MRLGERLVQEQRITALQLETALRAQVIYGGRLGTNLVELAYLSLDALSTALADQLGVPAALASHFEQVDAPTVGLLPPRLAEKHQAIPLGLQRLAGRQLAVAFTDPRLPGAVDEIASATGAKITPCVAPELRILYYLEKLYRIPRKNRFLRVDLGPSLTGGERRRSVTQPPVPAEAAPQQPVAPAVSSARPALVAADAITAINAAGQRDEIGDTLVDYLRSGFGVGVVMVIREGVALGWKGFAPGGDRDLVESIAVPLGATSFLSVAHDGKSIFRGAPPADGSVLQGRFWKALRVAPAREVVVCPIILRGRVISLVYAHAVDGGTLPEATTVDLAAVCAAAATAFARLIQTGKGR
jgi:hypothetical protein